MTDLCPHCKQPVARFLDFRPDPAARVPGRARLLQPRMLVCKRCEGRLYPNSHRLETCASGAMLVSLNVLIFCAFGGKVGVLALAGLGGLFVLCVAVLWLVRARVLRDWPAWRARP